MNIEIKEGKKRGNLNIKFKEFYKTLIYNNAKINSITEFENCLLLRCFIEDKISDVRIDLFDITESSQLRIKQYLMLKSLKDHRVNKFLQ